MAGFLRLLSKTSAEKVSSMRKDTPTSHHASRERATLHQDSLKRGLFELPPPPPKKNHKTRRCSSSPPQPAADTPTTEATKGVIQNPTGHVLVPEFSLQRKAGVQRACPDLQSRETVVGPGVHPSDESIPSKGGPREISQNAVKPKERTMNIGVLGRIDGFPW